MSNDVLTDVYVDIRKKLFNKYTVIINVSQEIISKEMFNGLINNKSRKGILVTVIRDVDGVDTQISFLLNKLKIRIIKIVTNLNDKPSFIKYSIIVNYKNIDYSLKILDV